MSGRILVPIDLEALIVEAEDVIVAPPINGAPLGTGSALAPGVHLHWALPDSLTRGRRIETTDGEHRLAFDAVPDYWLVTRFGPELDAQGRRVGHAWLVDAYHETVTVLGGGATPQPVATPGRPLLTAVGKWGYGQLDPAIAPDGWVHHAAYYPGAAKRFGFHDTPDLSQGNVSYGVVGWYSDPNEDPTPTLRDLTGRGLRAAATAEPVRTTPIGLEPLEVPTEVTLRRPRRSAVGPAGLRLDSARVATPVAQPEPEPPVESARGSLRDALGGLRSRLRARVTDTVNERIAAPIREGLRDVRIPERFERIIGAREGERPSAEPPRDDFDAHLVRQLIASSDDRSGSEAAQRVVDASVRGIEAARAALDGLPVARAPLTPAGPPRDEGLMCHGAVVDVGASGVGAKAYASERHRRGQDSIQKAQLVPQLGEVVPALLGGLASPDMVTALQLILEGQGSALKGGVQSAALADATLAHGFAADPGPIGERWTAYVYDATDPRATGSAPPPPVGTPIWVVDRRATPDRLLPAGIDPAGLSSLVNDTSRVVLERQLDPGARWFRPSAPVLMFRGHGRPSRHGGDGRFDADGHLVTRAPTELALMAHVVVGSSQGYGVTADMLAVLPTLPTWIPPVALDVIREVVVLDPLNNARIMQSVPVAERASAARVHSGKVPPSFSRRLYRPGFSPLVAECAYRFTAASGSIVTGTERALVDICTDALSASVRALALGESDAQKVIAFEEAAARLDALDAFTAALPALGDTLAAQGIAVREGTLELVTLRLIDTFGQVRDFDTSGPTFRCTLPRAFAAPARLSCRLVDAGVDLGATAAEAGPTVSPLAGFLVPDPIEHAVEVFDHQGRALGQLRGSGTTVVAERAPGQTAELDTQLGTARPALAQLARALVTWAPPASDAVSSVEAFTRLVDATRLLVEPRALSEHRSMLFGRPVMLMRGRLALERGDRTSGTTRPAPLLAGKPPLRTQVRLGNLSRADDGLLGYWIGTRGPDGAAQWSKLYVIRPRLTTTEQTASPIAPSGVGDPFATVKSLEKIPSSYLAGGAPIELVEGQAVELLLALDARLGFFVSCDELPAKHVDPPPAFGADQLDRLSVSYRGSPVLIDPASPNLPAPSIATEDPHWIRETGGAPINLGDWGSSAGQLPHKRMRVDEGWIRFDPRTE